MNYKSASAWKDPTKTCLFSAAESASHMTDKLIMGKLKADEGHLKGRGDKTVWFRQMTWLATSTPSIGQ